jgi:hypothetical protein
LFDIFAPIGVGADAPIDKFAPARTLVVADRPPTAEFLNIEVQAYLAAQEAGGMEIVFTETDEDGNERWARDDDGPFWGERMALAPGTAATPDQVVAWLSAKAAAVFVEWEPRLADAWIDAEKLATERAKRR